MGLYNWGGASQLKKGRLCTGRRRFSTKKEAFLYRSPGLGLALISHGCAHARRSLLPRAISSILSPRPQTLGCKVSRGCEESALITGQGQEALMHQHGSSCSAFRRIRSSVVISGVLKEARKTLLERDLCSGLVQARISADQHPPVR